MGTALGSKTQNSGMPDLEGSEPGAQGPDGEVKPSPRGNPSFRMARKLN